MSICADTMKRWIWLRGNPATGGDGASWQTVTDSTPIALPGSVGKPLRRCEMSIDPVQQGSGDPAPDNIRSISGWSGANIWRTGVNLLDPAYRTTNRTDAVDYYRASDQKLTLEPGTYTLSCSETCGAIYVLENGSALFTGYDRQAYTFTINSKKDLYFVFFHNGSSTIKSSDCQLEVGSSASPYTPYSGTSVAVEFPAAAGTVYGGTIDPVAGTLTVTHKGVDLGSLSWTRATSRTNPYFVAAIPDMKSVNSNAGNMNTKTSMFKNVAGTTALNNADMDNVYNCTSWEFGSNNNNIAIVCKDYTDAASFTIAVTGQTLLYDLTTPITYQLTPVQIATIGGGQTNYVWADCGGQGTVEYKGKV